MKDIDSLNLSDWFQSGNFDPPLKIFNPSVAIFSNQGKQSLPQPWHLLHPLHTVCLYGGLWCGHVCGRRERGIHETGHNGPLVGGLRRWWQLWHSTTESGKRLHGKQPQLGRRAPGYLYTTGRRLSHWRANQTCQHLCEWLTFSLCLGHKSTELPFALTNSITSPRHKKTERDRIRKGFSTNPGFYK